MRSQLSILAARLAAPLVALAVPLIAGEAARAGGNDVLVELFTSQGCNSCPPADAALGEYAALEGVVALSLHVDYWDYLGWRDTFADSAHTKRQYAYRAAFGERAVYTPQIVVDGRTGVVGSKKAQVAALIADAQHTSPGAGIRLDATDDGLVAMLSPGAVEGPFTVWCAVYDRSRTVEIGRGENRGKTLTYSNVVRELRRLAEWTAQAPQRVKVLRPASGQGVAVWVQRGEGGPVLGAAKYEP